MSDKEKMAVDMAFIFKIICVREARETEVQ